VLQAAGPKEALAAASRHQGPIDLVLADVIMPEMSGPEMVTLLAEQHPEASAVYLLASCRFGSPFRPRHSRTISRP